VKRCTNLLTALNTKRLTNPTVYFRCIRKYLDDEDETGDGCYANGVVMQPMGDRLLTTLNSTDLTLVHSARAEQNWSSQTGIVRSKHSHRNTLVEKSLVQFMCCEQPFIVTVLVPSIHGHVKTMPNLSEVSEATHS